MLLYPEHMWTAELLLMVKFIPFVQSINTPVLPWVRDFEKSQQASSHLWDLDVLYYPFIFLQVLLNFFPMPCWYFYFNWVSQLCHICASCTWASLLTNVSLWRKCTVDFIQLLYGQGHHAAPICVLRGLVVGYTIVLCSWCIPPSEYVAEECLDTWIMQFPTQNTVHSCGLKGGKELFTVNAAWVIFIAQSLDEALGHRFSQAFEKATKIK